MRVTDFLSDLARYLNELILRAGHPQSGWSAPRRRFVHSLLVALLTAGTTVLSDLVRHLPDRRTAAVRHRYKAADRMLGDIDLVPVAAEQTAILGREVGPGHVVAIDLSDIQKPYARSMEALAPVFDGDGKGVGPGYGLVTATAFDATAERKAMPVPLRFSLWSSASDDFDSTNTLWLETIDLVCDHTHPEATVVIDREGDNRRIIDRLLKRRKPFVLRLQAGNSSRLVLFGADSRARVRDAWKEATFHGTLTATRIADDGQRKPYTADYGSLAVRLPGCRHALCLCVYDSLDHLEPLVLLTSHEAGSPEAVARILTLYFARWAAEEVHRFAKQAFHLEDLRLLTWRRLLNVVALVWIALGALFRLARLPSAEPLLRELEARAGRLRRPLTKGQFWGYALADGIRAALLDARPLLRLLAWLKRPDPADRQLPLFAGRP